jgi:hypothetical protein
MLRVVERTDMPGKKCGDEVMARSRMDVVLERRKVGKSGQ